jgi:uncharacterized repeat protein (TIGR02543 family)
VQAQTVASGGKANEPQGVTRNGYTLAGWFRDDTTFQNQWNFATDTVTQNITLYAKWNQINANTRTVTFNSGGGSAVPSQQVDIGNKVTEPQGVTRTNYALDGWYTNDSLTNQWDFANDTVSGDMTLYAKWTRVYTVTFNSGGGSTVTAQIIRTGEKAAEPQDVTYVGNTFVGWFRDDTTFQNQWNFTTDTVTQDITLYAKWTCTVTFDSNGGSAVTAQTVDHGSKAADPQNVSQSGFTLAGWYSDNNTFQNQWNFATDTVTQNVTLYAKWTYIITFDSNGGSSVQAQAVAIGEKAVEPQGVTLSGCLLVGWFKETALTNQWNFATDNVTQNTTLYAKWTSSPEMVFVQGGTFKLGEDLGTAAIGDVTPVSNVTVNGFYIGKYEVTQSQYQAVMGTTIQQQQALASTAPTMTNYGRGDAYPIYFVSWYDALVFCNKLSVMEGLTPAYRISDSTNPDDWGIVPTHISLANKAVWDAVTIDSNTNGYRLPTEAQWEYAAKGGNTGEAFTYAGSDTVGDVAWYKTNHLAGGTSAVGTKAPNGLGLYDMSGNVAEWCWDWYDDDYYTSEEKTDPTGASSGSNRVTRGGSWYLSAEYIRSAERMYNGPDNRADIFGFRLVRPAQ